MDESDRRIIDNLHAFADREIVPIEEALGATFTNPRLHYDETGKETPAITDARRRARMKSAEAGFYTMFCSKKFGGEDLGIRLWFLCWESMFHRYGMPKTQLVYEILSTFFSGPHEVWNHASEELRAEVMPGLATGKLQGCFGLTEPDAGSDSWMMRTQAVRDGSDWIINGSKQWTTNSPTADFIMLYAVTDKAMLTARKGGVTCFYVPTSTPGFKVESVLSILGELGGNEGILSFTDMRVPDKYRIGELNRGFDLAMLGVRHGRLANAGRTLGTARWALEKAIDYAKVRRTFGAALAEHQTIQNYLADATIKLYAGRLMALDAATKADLGRDIRTEASMAKAFCTQAAFEIIDKCMQIHGGMGLANETKLYQALHQARATHVTEGPNEIQRRSIAQNLLRGRVDLTFE
ncbi:MAG: acyl-CoA dehydrogenase family protein [Caulobacteraceae bacterium]|nr:acyl-CoA dehydrogenase family protein [Caulobacteraceae bacterium]